MNLYIPDESESETDSGDEYDKIDLDQLKDQLAELE